MRFSKALPLLFKELQGDHIDFALVGGLAMYTLGFSRTTFDADFMILLAQADAVEQIMNRLGYQSHHKTQDVANYSSQDSDMGQVDFLFAHRRYAVAMLQRAGNATLLGYPVKVIRPEDLIGLKVQSSSNDLERTQKDRADIEEILRNHGKTMDWSLVEEYFRVFDRETEYKDLRKRFG